MLPVPVTLRGEPLVPASASVVTVCAAFTASVPPPLVTPSVPIVFAPLSVILAPSVEQVKFVKVFEPATARPVPVVSVGAYTKSFMFVFAVVALPVSAADAPVIVILAALASSVPAFVMPPLVSMSPEIVAFPPAFIAIEPGFPAPKSTLLTEVPVAASTIIGRPSE